MSWKRTFPSAQSQLKWSRKTGRFAGVYSRPVKGYNDGGKSEGYNPVFRARLSFENDLCRTSLNGESDKEACQDPARSSQAEHQSAVQVGAAEPIRILLRTARDGCGRTDNDERDRRGVYQLYIIRQPSDCGLWAPRRHRCCPASREAPGGQDGFAANYKPLRTSQPHPSYLIFPYLLRKVQIDRTDQIWSADSAVVSARYRVHHLVAIMDWASLKVLSWRFLNSIHADICGEALNEALAAKVV